MRGRLVCRYQSTLKDFARSDDTLGGLLNGIHAAWRDSTDVVTVVLTLLVAANISKPVRVWLCVCVCVPLDQDADIAC